jgi:hypothetical protein
MPGFKRESSRDSVKSVILERKNTVLIGWNVVWDAMGW